MGSRSRRSRRSGSRHDRSPATMPAGPRGISMTVRCGRQSPPSPDRLEALTLAFAILAGVPADSIAGTRRGRAVVLALKVFGDGIAGDLGGHARGIIHDLDIAADRGVGDNARCGIVIALEI